MLDVNVPGAAVAALATFLIGGPWYSKALFGARWSKAMSVSDAKPGHPAKVFGFAYLPAAALLIDGGYHVAQFAAFGLVLGLWPG